MNKLFLRTCNSDGTSYEGFQWNLEIGGITEAPDWNPEPECGGGLHGLLHGKGDGEYLDHSKDSLWMVCEALGPIVDLDRKIKTSKAKTLFVGDRKGATDFLVQFDCNPAEVVGAFITGGDGSKIIGDDWSTLTGGDGSTVTGGHWSTLTGGRWATVTGGVYSTLKGGNWSTLKGGDNSIITGGEYSIITGGTWSTLKGGHWSTVTDGNYSMVTGGDYSIVTGGKYSTVTGGDGSILSLKWFDGKRIRIVTAYVGEDGIEPNVAYKLDENGKFVRA